MPVRRPRPVLVHRRAASTAPKAICIAVALCIAGTAQAQTQTGDGGIAPSNWNSTGGPLVTRSVRLAFSGWMSRTSRTRDCTYPSSSW